MGQAIYQFAIIWFLQTRGKVAFHLEGPDTDLTLNTLIFNSFVFCQVKFNLHYIGIDSVYFLFQRFGFVTRMTEIAWIELTFTSKSA